jgi:hypothetical protein
MYPQYQQPQPVYYGQQQYSGCVKFLLYALSFFMPLVGIIVGIVFMSRPDPESKGLGKACLIISIAAIVLWCCVSIVVATLSGAVPFLMIPFTEY